MWYDQGNIFIWEYLIHNFTFFLAIGESENLPSRSIKSLPLSQLQNWKARKANKLLIYTTRHNAFWKPLFYRYIKYFCFFELILVVFFKWKSGHFSRKMTFFSENLTFNETEPEKKLCQGPHDWRTNETHCLWDPWYK